MYAWNTDTTSERSIDIDFSFEEGLIVTDVFEFDSDIFASIDFGSLESDKSYEVTSITSHMDYLCTHRRSLPHRFSFEVGIYRLCVNPDMSCQTMTDGTPLRKLSVE